MGIESNYITNSTMQESWNGFYSRMHQREWDRAQLAENVQLKDNKKMLGGRQPTL
ncbi:hypothetical protein PIB30_094621, partial [Stylosanthes scabra]|nr:hypothetical protein [Stylosanthes scabra]